MRILTIADVKNALQEMASDLQKYVSLMDRLHKVGVSNPKDSISQEFRRNCNSFFRIRQKPEAFYTEYYKLLEQHKNDGDLTFETVIKHLHKKVGSVEPSFSSKLLSMINPNMPVWDSMVVENLKLKEPPHYRQKDGKKYANIHELDEFYREAINKWYCGFVETNDAKKWIELFDKQYPEAKNITKVKKIDLILWKIR